MKYNVLEHRNEDAAPHFVSNGKVNHYLRERTCLSVKMSCTALK
jgi:hypothetical protein